MLMSLLITVSLMLGGVYSQDAEQLKYDLFRFATGTNAFKIFHEWAERYEKSYGDLITTWLRFKIFADNMKKAINLDQKYGGSAMFGPTQFADLTPQEFASTYLVTNMENMVNSSSQTEDEKFGFKTEAVGDNEPPLETVDWTEEGVVTSIKDQGRVGTCYIFAALAVIESRWAQKGNEPISLSAEQVADCLAVFGGLFSDNLACGVNGGLQPAVYRYIQEEGGITADKDYPYCVGDFTCKPCPPENYSFLVCGAYPYASCRKSDSCQAKYDSSKFVPGLKVKSWSYVSKDETKIAKVLSDEGPLSSALDATDLQLYHSGILQQDKCKPDKLNHAVVLVGYGQEGDTKYWKVKNSWGDQFGEKGYFRIARGSGTCGINRMVTTVDVE